MDDELLVFCVRDYPNLYDYSHPKYNDNLVKHNSWREISEKMNFTAKECSSRWQSVRECYRKTIKKQATKTGKPSKKKWRLELQMEFLKPFLCMQNEQTTNTNLPPDEESELVRQNQNYDESEADQSCESMLDPNVMESTLISPHHTLKTQPMNILKSTPSMTPSGAVFKDYLGFEKQQFLEQRGFSLPKVDHLTKYFQSIEETVRTFPTPLQIKVKSQISTIVHNAELEALNLSESSQIFVQLKNSPPTPSS